MSRTYYAIPDCKHGSQPRFCLTCAKQRIVVLEGLLVEKDKRIAVLEGLVKEIENLRYYNREQYSHTCKCGSCTLFGRVDEAVQTK